MKKKKRFRPFDEIKAGFDLESGKYIADVSEQMFAHIIPPENRVSYEHGQIVESHTLDGKETSTSFRPIEASLIIKHDYTINGQFKKYGEALDELIEKFNAEMGKMIFEGLRKVTESTGNVVDGGGKPLSKETILEAYKKIEVGYDENGASLAQLVVNPKMHDRAKEIMSDPEFKIQLNQIIEQKIKVAKERYEAHLARFEEVTSE